MVAFSSGFENVSSFLAKSEHQPLAIPTTSIPSGSSDPSTDPPGALRKKIYTSQPPPQLDHEQYPDVRQWFPTDYNDRRKVGKGTGEGGSAADGPKSPVLSSYMEDEHGRLVPMSTRAAIRAMAKDFFWKILRDGRAPAKWGDAGLDVSNELICLLETNYPWLRLCQDHWKAKKVATNSYSQWYSDATNCYNKETRLQGKAPQPPTTDIIDVDSDTDTQKRPLKRRLAEDDGAGRSKRPHLEETPSCAQPARPTATRRRVRVFYYSHRYMCH